MAYVVVDDDEGSAYANTVHFALVVGIAGDDEGWVANDGVYE